ncbi:MAG: hypothetical protein ABSE87_13820 [Terracidiphilus sp.]|jgi:hypothetical protein
MNILKHNTLPPNSGPSAGIASSSAEETLRLIARLPAPDGLAERVQAGLRAASLSASNPVRARILHWPVALQLDHAWMRGAAAAAIVFVVAGGGWGIYSRVAPVPQIKGIALPHVAAPGGFAGAGAMRTPQTLNGPAVVHPAPQASKSAAKAAPASSRAKSAAAKKAAAQTNVPALK